MLAIVNCVRANLVVNGDFNSNADGWTLIGNYYANWYSRGEKGNAALTGGWDGTPRMVLHQ